MRVLIYTIFVKTLRPTIILLMVSISTKSLVSYYLVSYNRDLSWCFVDEDEPDVTQTPSRSRLDVFFEVTSLHVPHLHTLVTIVNWISKIFTVVLLRMDRPNDLT